MLTSTIWLHWRLGDRLLSLLTWQHPRSSALALAVVSTLFGLALCLPGWATVNLLFTSYLVPFGVLAARPLHPCPNS